MTNTLPLRVDCSEPGCKRCAAQIVDGVFRFRAVHDGQRHEIKLPLDALLRVLAATKESQAESKQLIEIKAA